MPAAKFGALVLLFAILSEHVSADESVYRSKCNNTLNDHLDAFRTCNVDKIMTGYSTDAKLILGGVEKPWNGTDEIKANFANFFKALCPEGVPGTVALRQPPETVCNSYGSSTYVCVSYIFYSMQSANLNIPLATDTFTYDAQAHIVLQTFTGPSVPVPGSDPIDQGSLSRHQELGIALGVFAVFAVAGFVVLKPCELTCCRRK